MPARISRRASAMDASQSTESVAKATFFQRLGLGMLLSKIKTSWRRRFRRRNTRFSYKVTMPRVPSPIRERHPPSPSPEPVEAPVHERMTQKMAEEDSLPSWACDDEDELEPRPAMIVFRTQAQVERLRNITERFNLPMPDEFVTACDPETERPRVHRQTRMRVHRSCHRCNTMFGGARDCPGCQHRVCGLCHRHPRQRYTEAYDPISDDPFAADQDDDQYQEIRQQMAMARANRVPSQPLVRKPLRQRVRRTCHSCSTLFTERNRICTNCQHTCCGDCPRFPPKRAKYPNGYPGDEPASSSTAPISHASSSTAPISYACHECYQIYPPVPHPDSLEGQTLGDAGILNCVQCGHTRCPSCERAPPPMAGPAPSSSIAGSVDSHLAT